MCSIVKIKQALIEVPDKDHRRLDVFVFWMKSCTKLGWS